MKNLFSSDSKIMQTLMFITDVVFLNFLFVLCSLPLVTIGAAQCGLHTGVRALLAKESMHSPTKAFFKGFCTNLGQITGVFCAVAAVIGLLVYCAVAIWLMNGGRITIVLAVALLALCLSMMYQCMLSLIHSRFQCSLSQLLRNSALIMFSRPIHSLIQAGLFVLPLGVALLDMEAFVRYGAGWITVYYAAAAVGCYFLFKKTFEELTVNIVSEAQ